MKTASILVMTTILLSGCWISNEKKPSPSKDSGAETVSVAATGAIVPVVTRNGVPITGTGRIHENNQK